MLEAALIIEHPQSHADMNIEYFNKISQLRITMQGLNLVG
jgi:hypothetical protein